jgi:UDP-N-acetylmuramoylalanine--D-glutamate ligase
MKTHPLLAELKGKRIAVIGLAREGLALTRFLVECGAQVTVSDSKTREQLQANLAQLADLPVRYVLGEHPSSLLETDIVFLSPGIPLDIPLVRAARERRLPISTETRLFLELCPAPVIGVTGSSGKTTTVTLVGEMGKTAGRRTWVGGNIGQPLIGHLTEIETQDCVVTELSSFQLELFAAWSADTVGCARLARLSEGASPRIAAILNITPNHLDRHASMEEYIAAKENILRCQQPGDWAILSQDDSISWELRQKARGQLLTFSLREQVQEGAFLDQDKIMVRRNGQDAAICSIREVKLLGRHNLANILAACAIASAADISTSAMAAVARNFAGVEHRLEWVRTWRGARYYNDSIATSPERAIAALNSFDAPIVLLAGGRDKHLPWDHWGEVVACKVKRVVLFGEAAPLIERALLTRAEHPRYSRCETMAEALRQAAQEAQPGEVVLLSPGGTSFDAFCDFAERGIRFKELVNRLADLTGLEDL